MISSTRPQRSRRKHLPDAEFRLLCAMALVALAAGGAGAQSFTELVPGLPNTAFPCVAAGDIDGDGDLDLLIAGSGSHDVPFTKVFRNTGGTFTDSGIVLTGLSRATAAWGDLDGDGDLDLAMTGLNAAGAPAMVVSRNNGATFSVVPGSYANIFAGSVAWADDDGDGDLDLLVTGLTAASAAGIPLTRLYRNDAGVLTPVAHPFPNCYSGAVAWGDYNGDNRLDVVIVGMSDNAGMVASIWRNDGGGAFTDIGAGLPGADLGFAAWSDFDNDGDPDLLFGGNSNDGYVTRLYRNDAGTFTDANAGFLGLIWASAVWGDYDNDGDPDVAAMGYDAVAQVPRSIVYRNDAGTFVDSGATFHDLYLGTAAWLDHDNDGDLDLLLVGNDAGHDLTTLFRNNAATPNAPPAAPASLAVNIVGASAEFSWTAPVDDHTPAAGLSYNLRVGTTPGGGQIVSAQSLAGGTRLLAAAGNAQSGLTARLDHLQPGMTYYWSVQAVDAAFAGSAFGTEGVWAAPAGVGDPSPRLDFALLGNEPNPFNPKTTIRFDLPQAQVARVAVYALDGRLVRTLLSESLAAGSHAVEWNGTDQRGCAVASGTYFCRIEAGSSSATRKMLLAK